MDRDRVGDYLESGWKSLFESSDLSIWLAGKVKVLHTYVLVSLLAFYCIKIPVCVSGAASPASRGASGCWSPLCVCKESPVFSARSGFLLHSGTELGMGLGRGGGNPAPNIRINELELPNNNQT